MSVSKALFGRKPTTSLGIIGTAGRGSDAKLLTLATFNRMVSVAQDVCRDVNAWSLISGGAAWADHVAVNLALSKLMLPLTLHLPGELLYDEIDGHKSFQFVGKDGKTATHYHDAFRHKTGINGMAEIDEAQRKHARVTVSAGFLARNKLVAADATALLAFTFGRGPKWEIQTFTKGTSAEDAGLKDGGTARTWNASEAPIKMHVTLE